MFSRYSENQPARNPVVYRTRACVGVRSGFRTRLRDCDIPLNIVGHIAAVMLSVVLIDIFGRKPKCHSQTLSKIARAASAWDTGTTTAS